MGKITLFFIDQSTLSMAFFQSLPMRPHLKAFGLNPVASGVAVTVAEGQGVTTIGVLRLTKQHLVIHETSTNDHWMIYWNYWHHIS